MMDSKNLSNQKKEIPVSKSFSSEMKIGFGYFQVQDEESFKNFMQKIEVDESNNQLTLTFTKLANDPIVIDFKNHQMKLPSKKVKDFKKFVSVTYEFLHEKKSVVMKTFRFNNGKLYKGIKYFGVDDIKRIKFTNFLEIYNSNYEKNSVMSCEDDKNYVYSVPDFYKKYMLAS